MTETEIKDIILSCRKEGHFKLHSGQYTDHIYDVMSLIDNEDFIFLFSYFVDWENTEYLVGIEFGGAVLAAKGSEFAGGDFGIVRKDGTIYGRIPDIYTLFDDVVTTENSIRQAIKWIGKEPKKIKCVIDRREHKDLIIESMYTETK